MSDNNNNDRTHGLIAFDSALEKYIKKNIAFDFSDKNDNIKTSVLFAKPEQWTELKDKATVKVNIDGNHVNLPVISLYRTDVIINKSMVPHWIEDKFLEYAIAKENLPTIGDKEYTKTVVQRRGIYVEMYYSVEIITQNHFHLDHLIEQFILNEGKYWSDDENFSMRVTYESFPDTSQSADQNQERIISTSFNVQMNGQILPKFKKEKKNVGNSYMDTVNVNFKETLVDL